MNKHRVLAILFLLLLVHSATDAQAIRGHDMRRHTIPVSDKKDGKTQPGLKPVVGFVSPVPLSESDPQTLTTWEQLNKINGFEPRFITVKEFMKDHKNSGKYTVLWFHHADSVANRLPVTDEKLLRCMKSFVETGGKILLTMQALHYINLLGYEPEKLTDSIKTCNDDGNGRRLGYHAFRSHPLFDGLNGGVYVLRPDNDIKTLITGYFRNKKPSVSKVVAVDWDYIFLRENSKLVFELTPGKGVILGVGGYIDFSVKNRDPEHLSTFLGNCLRYLVNHPDSLQVNSWDYSAGE